MLSIPQAAFTTFGADVHRLGLVKHMTVQGASCIAWVTALSVVLLSPARVNTREHRQRFERRDIGILAALTRLDHSTIFFHGYTQSGYVRDGVVQTIDLEDPRLRRSTRCEGRAVSRDGTRIAYIRPDTGERRGCLLVIREVATGKDTAVAEIPESWGVLAWSWGDGEISYQRTQGIYTISVGTGRERMLCRLPPRINGAAPSGSWKVTRINWAHTSPDLLLDVNICVPTGRPGTCNETGHLLRMSSDDGRVLAVGWGAAVSPVGDRVGFVTDDAIETIDFDGTNRRRLVMVPFATWFLPFFGRETTGWSKVSWSPVGDRLIFGTVLDEEFNSNYYLVDVRSRTRRRLLRNTSIDIEEWR